MNVSGYEVLSVGQSSDCPHFIGPIRRQDHATIAPRMFPGPNAFFKRVVSLELHDLLEEHTFAQKRKFPCVLLTVASSKLILLHLSTTRTGMMRGTNEDPQACALLSEEDPPVAQTSKSVLSISLGVLGRCTGRWWSFHRKSDLTRKGFQRPPALHCSGTIPRGACE